MHAVGNQHGSYYCQVRSRTRFATAEGRCVVKGCNKFDVKYFSFKATSACQLQLHKRPLRILHLGFCSCQSRSLASCMRRISLCTKSSAKLTQSLSIPPRPSVSSAHSTTSAVQCTNRAGSRVPSSIGNYSGGHKEWTTQLELRCGRHDFYCTGK
jgi:hypothetical protein